LNEEFELGYSIEQINHVGWEGEFAYHGIPSGVDNTASTYGGLLLYRIKNEKKMFENIEIRTPFRIVLANSGVTADTSKLDEYVESEERRNPVLFTDRLNRIREQAIEMKRALEANDL
jgi:mevalonate kinase